MIRQYPNSTLVFDYYQLKNELITDEDDEIIFRTQLHNDMRLLKMCQTR